MIYLLRHGSTDEGGERHFVGQLDKPLVAEGQRQAEQWREVFEAIELEAIFCSDLQRSLETASIIAGEKHPLPRTVTGLREISLGEWEGLAMSHVRQNFPQQWQERGLNMAGYRPPCGESFNDLKNRVIPVYKKLVSESKRDILIVAHAGVNRMILGHLLGMPVANLFRLNQDYAGLNLIDYSSGLPRIAALNLSPQQYLRGGETS